MLSGADHGVVYTLSLKGDAKALRATVRSQSWVTSLIETHSNGLTCWEVGVSDESTAEAELLRLAMSDRAVNVTDFGRKQHDLEEVFLSLVGDDHHGN